MHSLHCILCDIAVKPSLSLFYPHNTGFPPNCDSSGSSSNLFSDWCDSSPASNCRQERRTSTKYCASTKRTQQKLYDEESTSVVWLPSRVSPLSAATSSFLPHPLRLDWRNSAIFARRLSPFGRSTFFEHLIFLLIPLSKPSTEYRLQRLSTTTSASKLTALSASTSAKLCSGSPFREIEAFIVSSPQYLAYVYHIPISTIYALKECTIISGHFRLTRRLRPTK